MSSFFAEGKNGKSWKGTLLIVLALLVTTSSVLGQIPLQLPSTICIDEHMNCGFWGRSGECQINPDWMLLHCQLSCKVCNPSAVVAPPPLSMPLPHSVSPKLFSGASSCMGPIQTIEIATRAVPIGSEYRDRAFSVGCAVSNQANICSKNTCYHERFRTLDGSCNNLLDPMKGAAYTPYTRLLQANYEDGLDRIMGTSPGTRPNPRDVTHLLLSTRVAILTQFNGLIMQFGQFLSHDMTRNTVINVCTCATNAPHCANMPIPMHDTKRGECIPMTRSIPLCGTGATGRVPRTQMNENTAFIDASHIYGSDPRSSRELRAGALIKTSAFHRMVFPPPMGMDNILTGDTRSNLFVGLAAMHTIFIRYHNKIASQFFALNPQWDEERIFQETRKIVGATIQVITYQEFLPSLLGTQAAALIPPYTGYNPNLEPAVSNEFAAASYRLHGLIREFYRLVDKRWRPVGDLRFVDGAGQVEKLLNSGTDLLIRGMMTVASKRPQRLTTQVTEELFGLSDMGSLNIQRGRDHGLMNYNAYRKLCRLNPLTSFDDWLEVTNVDVRNRVRDLYGNPDNIDLYTGGLLEEPMGGSLLGSTFSCIIAEQFVRTRDADRFFHLNTDQYTLPQIAALKQLTLARVICETGEDFPEVPRNAFLVDDGSHAVPCTDIPPLDLFPWRETSPS